MKNSIQEELPSLRNSLIELIKNWLSSINAYGIPKIFRSNINLIMKIIWFSCVLASVGYCLYLLVQLIQMYTSFPSSISTEKVQEMPTQFPAVTICNLKTVNNAANLNFLNLVKNKTANQSTFEWISSIQYLMRAAVFNQNNETIRKSYGYQLENMLVSCHFNYNPCYLSDFTYFYDPLYGNCYTFNKQAPIKYVTIPGLSYGLTLELFLGNPPTETKYQFNDGIVVSIENQSSIPFTDVEAIKAASSSETDIIVYRNFMTQLPDPYGNCLKDTTINSAFHSIYFDYIVNTLNGTYSHNYCYSLCVQKQIILNCSCSNLNMPMFANHTIICKTSNDMLCVAFIVKNFGSTNASVDCKAACPYKCDSIQYMMTTYNALYPTEFYSKVLHDDITSKGFNINYNDAAKSFCKINVYYLNMEYTMTIQTASMDASTLFSNIFGTINFCLGLNMFTIVEVFELFLFIFGILILRYSKRRNTKVHNLGKEVNSNS